MKLTLRWTWPTFEWQVRATKTFYAGLKRRVRFHVWVVSRQNGKTALLEAVCIREGMQGGTYGYFAPSYDRSEEVYNESCEALHELIKGNLVTNKQTKAGWVIRFAPELCQGVARHMGFADWKSRRGGAIHFKSLGNPEHLRGQTLDGAVLDETGLVPGRVYRKIIRPMLTAKDGWVIFSGTPPEDDETPDPNFFRGLAEYARESEDKAWTFIHRDYRAHPSERVRAAIESERLRMPEQEFEREYMATFPNIEEFRLPPLKTWGPRSNRQNAGCPKILPDMTTVHSAIDLADNDNQIGDKAAVVTYAMDGTGRVFVLAAEYYRNPSEVLDAIYIHMAAYGTTKIAVQNSTFDKGFKHTVFAAEASRGPVPIWTTNLGGTSKRRRIMQLEPIARAGRLYVHEELRDFQLEWEQFPDNLASKHAARIRNRMRHHYDMIDAAAVIAEDIRDFATWNPAPPTKPNTMRSALKALKQKARGVSPSKHFRIG